MDDAEQTRSSRFCLVYGPDYFDDLCESEGPWYEAPEEIEAGLCWGRQKEALLRRIGQIMKRCLTKHEQRCVNLRFLHGLSFAEIGTITHRDGSSVWRTVERSIMKIRRALSQPLGVEEARQAGLARQRRNRRKRRKVGRPRTRAVRNRRHSLERRPRARRVQRARRRRRNV